ncbi:MAG: putative integral rane protein, partial [Acidimicrobiaceae bacterium]|nr:putative integral rane protein [Acidimicrobiaceae bacterium]
LAHTTRIAPADVWNFVGVLAQVCLVISLAVGAALYTRRWWAAFFGAVPFLVGTLSFTAQGWFTLMNSHAVVWGAIAVIFPLNSESASLAIARALFMFLLVLANRVSKRRATVLTAIVVGAGVGLLANIHTYGFFTALFLGTYCLSAYALATMTGRWPIIMSLSTIVLIVVLFQVGPPFANAVGRLAALALGLVPALPGLIIAVRRWAVPTIAALVAAGAAASPQIVTTWLALQHGNAFLKYREASSVALGLPWKNALLASTPLLIPLLLILTAGFYHKRPLWSGYAFGSIAAWFVLCKNDVWGANQEPYRFWIDGFALIAFTIVPIMLDVLLSSFGSRSSLTEPSSRRWKYVVATFSISAVVVGTISSIDWYRFYKSQEDQTFSLSTTNEQSWEAVGAKVTGAQLVLTDPCTDGQIFKAVTGDRVATYSPGLAWPARVKQLTAMSELLVAGKDPTPRQLHAAGVGWLVTDGNCSAHWPRTYAPFITRSAGSSYGPTPADTVILWRLRDRALAR